MKYNYYTRFIITILTLLFPTLYLVSCNHTPLSNATKPDAINNKINKISPQLLFKTKSTSNTSARGIFTGGFNYYSSSGFGSYYQARIDVFKDSNTGNLIANYKEDNTYSFGSGGSHHYLSVNLGAPYLISGQPASGSGSCDDGGYTPGEGFGYNCTGFIHLDISDGGQTNTTVSMNGTDYYSSISGSDTEKKDNYTDSPVIAADLQRLRLDIDGSNITVSGPPGFDWKVTVFSGTTSLPVSYFVGSGTGSAINVNNLKSGTYPVYAELIGASEVNVSGAVTVLPSVPVCADAGQDCSTMSCCGSLQCLDSPYNTGKYCTDVTIPLPTASVSSPVPTVTPTSINISVSPVVSPSVGPTVTPTSTSNPTPVPTPTSTPSKPPKGCDKPPVLSADKKSFVPNDDGIKDSVNFSVKSCKNWTLKIEPENLAQFNVPGFDNQSLTKTFTGHDNNSVTWDGRNELGEVLHTNYIVTVQDSDSKKDTTDVEIKRSKTIDFFLDLNNTFSGTDFPFQVASNSGKTFTIGACGGEIKLGSGYYLYPQWLTQRFPTVLDTVIGIFNYGTVTSVELHGQVKNAAGKVVHSWDYTGGLVSPDVKIKTGWDLVKGAFVVQKTWDGKDNSGVTVPEGNYIFTERAKFTYSGSAITYSAKDLGNTADFDIVKSDKGVPNKDELVLDTKNQPKHLPSEKTFNMLKKPGDNIHVFNDEETYIRVTNEILDHGELVDCERGGFKRYGLYFLTPIGYRMEMNTNGNKVKTNDLFYGEIKVRIIDNKYHTVPRVRPATD